MRCFVVGALKKSVPSSFPHYRAVESHLSSLPSFKPGSVEIVGSEGSLVAVVSVSGEENRDQIRNAAANAVRALRSKGASGKVILESFGNDEEAVLEGALLGAWTWSLKTRGDEQETQKKTLVPELASGKRFAATEIGVAAELEARVMSSLPANMLTPSIFCQRIESEAQNISGVDVRVFEEDEIQRMGMQGLIVVGKGSQEKIKLLQLVYRGRSGGDDSIDVALVGKGVTFDSGGVSIKPSANMADMKADMMGGACVAQALLALARQKAETNVVAIVPLVENMCSGSATRPGDVYTAMNGLTVEVDNTDAEGRLILADALYYAVTKFKPRHIFDVATLTGAIHVALGDRYYGVFCNNDSTWSLIRDTSERTGQPAWRMPLHPCFLEPMKSSAVADLINAGSGRGGGACTAAAFLEQFIDKHSSWAHFDIAGSMQSKSSTGVLSKGMTGVPTRTLIDLTVKASALKT